MSRWPACAHERLGLRATALAARGAARRAARCLPTVGPDFERPGVPPGWPAGTAAPSQPLAAEHARAPADSMQVWWRNFNDPVLDHADRRGAARQSERANRRPAHHGSARPARHRRQHALPAGPAGDQRTARAWDRKGPADRTAARRLSAPPVRISWELDFWGKFRRSIESADAAYLASIAQYDDVQVLMAAQVAGLYSSIRTVGGAAAHRPRECRPSEAQPGHHGAAVQGRQRVRTGCAAGQGPVPGHARDHPPARDHPAPDTERVEHAAGQAPGPVARDGRGQGRGSRRPSWTSSSTCRPRCCAAARTSGRWKCRWRPSPP